MFLIALCVSIVLEALARFIDPPIITNPEFILAVGCLGLASNLAGFVILGSGHEHSHGSGGHHQHGEEAHGSEEQQPSAQGSERAAEEGRAGELADQGNAADETGRVADVLPEVAVARYRASVPEDSRVSGRRDRRGTGAGRHGRLTSIDDISIHPASFRQDIIAAIRPQPDHDSGSDASPRNETAVVDETEPREDTPLLKGARDAQAAHGAVSEACPGQKRSRRASSIHQLHNHNKPREPGKGHGHNHGDMGMHALILHVLGDALGNVGVIITALVIWLTDWEGRYYADPVVSLFITLVILKTALPLTMATAKVLLQATPDNIDPNDVREDIEALPGVISCHHVHIWQLSDTKIVASMHIQVAFPISEANGERYMELSKMARKCLHAYGIHSATIQPEFCTDAAHAHGEQADAAMRMDGAAPASSPDAAAARPPPPRCDYSEGKLCLLDCVDDCIGQGCCSPPRSRPESTHSGEGQEEHRR